ncbi:MAG: hypothetical protein R3D43_09780 [Tepidamorphaceae bacterium]
MNSLVSTPKPGGNRLNAAYPAAESTIELVTFGMEEAVLLAQGRYEIRREVDFARRQMHHLSAQRDHEILPRETGAYAGLEIGIAGLEAVHAYT